MVAGWTMPWVLLAMSRVFWPSWLSVWRSGPEMMRCMGASAVAMTSLPISLICKAADAGDGGHRFLLYGVDDVPDGALALVFVAEGEHHRGAR